MENPWKNTTSEIYNGEEIIVATADLKYIKKLLNVLTPKSWTNNY